MTKLTANIIRNRLSVHHYDRARLQGLDNYVTAWYSLLNNAGFHDLRDYARWMNG